LWGREKENEWRERKGMRVLGDQKVKKKKKRTRKGRRKWEPGKDEEREVDPKYMYTRKIYEKIYR